MATCGVPSPFFQYFDAEDFHNTPAIRFMHTVPHRYGHTRNITRLLEVTEEEPKDYLKGLVATSITIFIIFVCWMLVLLLFKYLGPSEVGGLSGRLLPLSPKPDEKQQQQQVQEWDQVYQRTRRALNVARGVVIFSGLSIIVAALCMSILG
jgi:hypothetical protein